MNKEVEVKIQIDDKTNKTACDWLRNNAACHGEIHLIDYYFNKPDAPFFYTSPEGYKTARDYLRVRFKPNGAQLCLKRLHQDKKTGYPLYCDEYEVTVTDGKTTVELLKAIGYTDITILDKKRHIYRFKNFEIALDNVKKLGNFMEVELKEKVVCPKNGIKKIYGHLKTMGIRTCMLQKRGYVSMIWNPDYKFGELIELK